MRGVGATESRVWPRASVAAYRRQVGCAAVLQRSAVFCQKKLAHQLMSQTRLLVTLVRGLRALYAGFVGVFVLGLNLNPNSPRQPHTASCAEAISFVCCGMGPPYVIGVDGGTEGIRAGVFDTEGNALAFASCSYETTFPQPGWAEQVHTRTTAVARFDVPRRYPRGHGPRSCSCCEVERRWHAYYMCNLCRV